MGTGSEDSMAQPIDDADWDIAMIVLAVNTGPKNCKSRGMDHTVATSPFYSAWVETAQSDLAISKGHC